MLYGLRSGAVDNEAKVELSVVVVVVGAVAYAAGSSAGVAVLVIEGRLIVSVGRGSEVDGEGMTAARVMLSRRSWRTALRCLRWSLSRRVTFDALRDWSCVRAGGETGREGRRIARRMEVGSGPILDEKVDMLDALGE